jgi:crossover junction endodeoxyribonuclease RuvC
MAPKTILGIDPGTNLLGFGVIAVDAAGKPSFIDMGVLDLRRISSAYDKLECIHAKVSALCELHHPQDLAIESPFYGKNAQVILKLGRAQGAAMTAAAAHGLSVSEYAPREAKMAICGNGGASKEQVAGMLQRLLKLDKADMDKHLDATDALGAAYCHFMQMNRPESTAHFKSWKDFVNKNQDRVKK